MTPSCPDPAQLERLLAEQLPKPEYDDLARHVERCPACQAALEERTRGLLPPARRPAPLGPGPNGAAGDGLPTTDDSPHASAPPSRRNGRGPATADPLATTDYASHHTPAPGPRGAPGERAGDLPTIAGYALQAELGHGGMGVVYRAHHQRLGRPVALKMIRGGPYARPEHLARLRVEAETIARLHHPNIVLIYDIGEAAGLPFVSLELLEGGTLAERLGGTPQPPRAAVELTATLARAVAAAHAAGVVHRDLKPSNVLFDAAGTPKVTDFGLAKRLEQADGPTVSGQVLGSPSYMAPEQAGGDTARVGPPADVYALGAILYELLTGRPPFKGATPVETVRQVLDEEPVPPRRLVSKVPRDLETICLKCLAKEPHRRYASALALAGDLRRYLDGRPILARPTPAWERAWKWARRRPATSTLLALGLVVAVALVTAGVRRYEALRREDAHLARVRRAVDGRLFRIQQALAGGAYARVPEELAVVLGELRDQPQLADLRDRADILLREAARQRERAEQEQQADAARRADRARYEQFLQLRDEALFRDTQFTGLYPSDNVAAIRVAARVALAVFGTEDSEASWSLGPLPTSLSVPEREEVSARFYELLLVLADATAQARPGEDARRQAERGLRLLEQAGSLRPPTRAYHLRRAACLDRLGDAPAARREREAAERLEPAGAFDHLLAGQERLTRGDVPAAITQLTSALRAEPGQFWARCLLAVALLRSEPQRPAEAQAHLTACLDGHTELAWLYLLRGFASGQLGELDRTLAAAATGPAASALRAESEAQFAAAEADYRDALRRLEQSPNPELHYILLVNRGLVNYQRAALDAAQADFEAAIRLDDRLHHAHVGLARVFQARGQIDAAAAQFMRAIAARPDWAPLYRGRAEVQLGEVRAAGRPDPDRIESALRDLDEVVRREVPGARVLAQDHTWRGELLYRAGRHAEALAACDAALAVVPEFAEGSRWRLAALLELRRYDELLAACEGALAQGPPSAELYRLRGLARVARNDVAGAIADYTLALDREPGSVGLLGSRGWAYLLDGSARPALRDFEAAVRRAPEDADARLGRASARVALGRYREAIGDAEVALRRAELPAPQRYKASRVFAQAAVLAAADAAAPGPAADGSWIHYQDRARSLLAETLRGLPADQRASLWRETIPTDPALVALRRGPWFAQLTVWYDRLEQKPAAGTNRLTGTESGP